MKKIYSMAALVAALVAAFGCQKEEGADLYGEWKATKYTTYYEDGPSESYEPYDVCVYGFEKDGEGYYYYVEDGEEDTSRVYFQYEYDKSSKILTMIITDDGEDTVVTVTVVKLTSSKLVLQSEDDGDVYEQEYTRKK